ncbi:MAG TPA: 2-hydroxychromene-2-carboxylate isomerase [Azospirillaceae bacterium]|nr:2-hydroxychromene-2-carboxylate isomerase [Azospirillaceae bacterium]
MTRRVEFLFDLASPAAYLAWTQLPALAARTGAEIDYRPVLLGGIFKSVGNASPVTLEAKGRWFRLDMDRHAARYGVPLVWPQRFPLDGLPLMRGAVAAERAGRLVEYGDAIYGGMFGRGLDMNDPDILADVLSAAGFDPDALMAQAQSPEVKQALRAATDAAVALGVFGVPTFFIGGEMWFGQDRLGWVEEALAG